MTKEPIQNRNQLSFNMIVFHEEIYNGSEPLTVIGIRPNQVELYGDYSGGTHGVGQSQWMPINGLLIPAEIL